MSWRGIGKEALSYALEWGGDRHLLCWGATLLLVRRAYAEGMRRAAQMDRADVEAAARAMERGQWPG